jgi:hypothetical protein
MARNRTILALLLIVAIASGCPSEQGPETQRSPGPEGLQPLPPGVAEENGARVDTVAIPVVPPAPGSPNRP